MKKEYQEQSFIDWCKDVEEQVIHMSINFAEENIMYLTEYNSFVTENDTFIKNF